MNNEFNLIDEKWIPVLTCTGEVPRVGIKDALLKAQDIRDIAASNPMDRIAVLRFLLAVLYWCKGNPSEKDKQVAAFPVDWFAKLEEHRECFNLLGEGRRFYQTKQAQRSRSITDLLQEIPTGNNFWHFRHSTDGQEGLCPACCALGLLRLPLYCVSGLPDLKSGINGTPPIYVFAEENTLFRTLMLNWHRHDSLGEPVWQSDSSVQPGNRSLLYGLTIPARKVWLHDPDTKPSVCFACAAISSIIRECEYQTSGKVEDKDWNDPHAIYREEKERRAERATDLTSSGKFKMDRPWVQPTQGLVERHQDTGTTALVGFATDQAKNVDVWERKVRMPAISEKDNAQTILGDWNTTGNRLADKLRSPERRKKKETPVELESSISSFRPHVEHIVSRHPERLLQGGEEGWNKAAKEYEQPLKAAARSLAPDYTAEALLRRAEIERAVPRWSEPKPEGEKPKRKGKKQ